MSIREFTEVGAAAACLTGLAPFLALWGLWALFGDAMFDVVAVLLLAGAALAATWLLADVLRERRVE